MTDTTQEQKDQEILKLQKIDCLVKAIGTMVMIPKYESDPNNIGAKVFAGTIQQPILQGDYRDTALDKLNELIKQL